MPLFSYESFYSSWLQTSHQPYLKLNYQAVQIIEYSRKAQIQSQEEVIQLVQLILRHRISIG